ncbi:hypothetical protein L9F63_023140, partial [Diploptera punctata]
ENTQHFQWDNSKRELAGKKRIDMIEIETVELRPTLRKQQIRRLLETPNPQKNTNLWAPPKKNKRNRRRTKSREAEIEIATLNVITLFAEGRLIELKTV